MLSRLRQSFIMGCAVLLCYAAQAELDKEVIVKIKEAIDGDTKLFAATLRQRAQQARTELSRLTAPPGQKVSGRQPSGAVIDVAAPLTPKERKVAVAEKRAEIATYESVILSISNREVAFVRQLAECPVTVGSFGQLDMLRVTQVVDDKMVMVVADGCDEPFQLELPSTANLVSEQRLIAPAGIYVAIKTVRYRTTLGTMRQVAHVQRLTDADHKAVLGERAIYEPAIN